MWETVKSFFIENILSAGVKLVISLILLFIGFKLVKLLCSALSRGKLFSRLEKSVQGFLLSFIGIMLKTVLIISVAAYLGVPMTSMIALLGSVGIAIGLALQGGLSNIAGGIMILLFKPFVVGDTVQIGDTYGDVSSIGLFYTTVLSLENCSVVIPNGTVSSSTVTNFSACPTRRLYLDFSVAYSTDIDLARAVMLKAAAENSSVLAEPAPDVVMTEHGDSSLTLRLRLQCMTPDYWTLRFALLEKIKRDFDSAGIEIPFPQLDVHMDKQ